MFGGTQTSSSKGSYTPYTGLTAFNVVAVNPSKEEIEKLTEREFPFDVNYDIRSYGDRDLRPVVFYVKSTNGLVLEKLTFNVGLVENKSKSGSVQLINGKGQFKWTTDFEEFKANPANAEFLSSGVRPAYEGEQELFSFIQRLVKYKPSSKDANFLEDCINNKMTISDIYNGDFNGLKQFVNYCQSKEHTIGLVLAVKEKTVVGDDGIATVKAKQTIITKPEAFFTVFGNEVTDYHTNRLAEEVAKKQAEGYPLSNDLFTVNFQKFVKEDCIGNVPQQETVSGKFNSDDLPF